MDAAVALARGRPRVSSAVRTTLISGVRPRGESISSLPRVLVRFSIDGESTEPRCVAADTTASLGNTHAIHAMGNFLERFFVAMKKKRN